MGALVDDVAAHERGAASVSVRLEAAVLLTGHCGHGWICRLIAADATGVTFRYKDFRIKGPGRYKTMTLKPDEFIRRFLMHVLPNGFHRIRHYGLLSSGTKAATIVRARELIAAAAPAQTAHQPQPPDSAAATDKPPCPCCGGRMNIIETFKRGAT